MRGRDRLRLVSSTPSAGSGSKVMRMFGENVRADGTFACIDSMYNLQRCSEKSPELTREPFYYSQRARD